ncbi:hypothetical protein AB0F11_28935 [Streptomyces sp. NPDC032472]|uniref:hypothetical protein n=1 Tax=Streptomyces sp. NPDC032472 TaxID=3155018 RepID=UPI0033F1A8A4
MTRIGQAVILLHAGDREEARNRLRELWTEIGEDGDGLHRCTLAHYMADAQDDPADELSWDLRALTAADGLREGAGEGPGVRDEPHPAVRGFYPSLHLSLAADYAKLQRPAEARVHLARARAAAGVLPDDGWANGIRTAITRLEHRLASPPDPPPGPFPSQHP